MADRPTFIVQSCTETRYGWTATAVAMEPSWDTSTVSERHDPIEITFPVPAKPEIGARYEIVACD